MLITPSLSHCSNKYKLAREGEKDKGIFFFRMKSSSAERDEFSVTFTFMHLADAFIQSDLHCIQVTVIFFYILSALAFPGNRTHDLGVASAMLYHLSYRKACIQLLLDD